MKNFNKITESANTPEKIKERFEKMCKKWKISPIRANTINEKCEWLQEHFWLSEKDSWLIAKSFNLTKWWENYINAVLQDIENEELEKKQYEADWNHSSFW